MKPSFWIFNIIGKQVKYLYGLAAVIGELNFGKGNLVAVTDLSFNKVLYAK